MVTLLVALGVALLLHAALLPWGASVLASPSVRDAFLDEEVAEPEPQNDAPDLVVGRTWSPPRVAVDAPTPLRFEVLNRSSVSAAVVPPTPWWTDAVFVSRDRVLDDRDVLLQEADALRSLGAGAVYEVQRDVTITDEMFGSLSDQTQVIEEPGEADRWFFLFVTDAGADVDESTHENNNTKAVPFDLVSSNEEPTNPQLGKDDVPTRLTVAWISHEAFEALQAPEGRTVQPVIQSSVEPTPDAPLRPSESPAAAPPAEPAPPATATVQTQETTEKQVETASADPPEAQAAEPVSDVVEAPASPLPEPAAGLAMTAAAEEESSPATPDNSEQPEPTEPQEPEEEAPAQEDAEPSQPSAPPAGDMPEEPTSAPKDEADADPSDLVPVRVMKPGAVEVSEGLQVMPARPDFAVTALLTTIPNNPVVRITFGTDGVVIDAELVTSAGSVTFDAPIRASLFRWKAKGEQLGKWTEPHTFRFTIYLTDRK